MRHPRPRLRHLNLDSICRRKSLISRSKPSASHKWTEHDGLELQTFGLHVGQKDAHCPVYDPVWKTMRCACGPPCITYSCHAKTLHGGKKRKLISSVCKSGCACFLFLSRLSIPISVSSLFSVALKRHHNQRSRQVVLSVFLSACLSVSLCVCVSVCLSVCQLVFSLFMMALVILKVVNSLIK